MTLPVSIPRRFVFASNVLLVSMAALGAFANDWPQWRGPERDGISTETGLLQAWPFGGPPLADGRLYLNAESGEVALVEPTSEGYRERGRFTPPGRPVRSQPMEKGWAYPVVANGKLFLRDHGQLWCYDVGDGARRQ